MGVVGPQPCSGCCEWRLQLRGTEPTWRARRIHAAPGMVVHMLSCALGKAAKQQEMWPRTWDPTEAGIIRILGGASQKARPQERLATALRLADSTLPWFHVHLALLISLWGRLGMPAAHKATMGRIHLFVAACATDTWDGPTFRGKARRQRRLETCPVSGALAGAPGASSIKPGAAQWPHRGPRTLPRPYLPRTDRGVQRLPSLPSHAGLLPRPSSRATNDEAQEAWRPAGWRGRPLVAMAVSRGRRAPRAVARQHGTAIIKLHSSYIIILGCLCKACLGEWGARGRL